MRNLLIAWCYILAMVNLVIWSAVYGNVTHGASQHRPHNINMTREVFPVKPQWI
jgi:hypothetical protein